MFRRRAPKPAHPPPERPSSAAFADLYARFAGRIHAYALQRLRDPDLAADVTSTVFTRALAALETFDAHGSDTAIEGWLLAIARNAIIDQIRADSRLTILDAETYRRHLTGHAPDLATAAVAPNKQASVASVATSASQRRTGPPSSGPRLAASRAWSLLLPLLHLRRAGMPHVLVWTNGAGVPAHRPWRQHCEALLTPIGEYPWRPPVAMPTGMRRFCRCTGRLLTR